MVDENITTFFNNIYDDTYRKVAIYITAKCGCAADIDDIIQETYIDVYAAVVRKGIDYIKQPEAFVMKVCKSKIQKHYSLRDKISKVMGFLLKQPQQEEGHAIELESLDYSIEDEVINRQLSQKIWDLISSKEDEILRIFRMFYVYELTIGEIANQLAMGESNVKNKLYRTVKEIRNSYSKEV